ncbi:nuclear transport factor 2 family protein [Nocardioides sp. GXQ0305]|uniref:nuclear transport factor 2 family protein n=1 Tax=Nocardioides sp. GXQ0305 TaxID=3423912 RepID=UPI003D7F1197
MTDHAELIQRHIEALEARDWEGFAATLHPDIVYEAHQTRERVTGREAYLAFNRGFPGDWHLTISRLVADQHGGAVRTDARVGDETMTGIHFFTVADGLVSHVDDFWPEPYEPPPGREHLVERW